MAHELPRFGQGPSSTISPPGSRGPNLCYDPTSGRIEGFQNLSLRPLKSSKIVRQTPQESPHETTRCFLVWAFVVLYSIRWTGPR